MRNLNGIQRELDRLQRELAPQEDRNEQAFRAIYASLQRMAERQRQWPENLPPPDPEMMSHTEKIAMKMAQALDEHEELQIFLKEYEKWAEAYQRRQHESR